MVWAVGEKSQEFGQLREKLNDAFMESGKVRFSSEKKEFSPHITLGRIKQWEWHRMEQEEIPEINEDIDFNFEASSIEVMESELKKTGPEYIILESEQLKD